MILDRDIRRPVFSRIAARLLMDQATKALLDQAIERHQAGDIAAAQPLYHDVLRREPQHALALRNLGLIAQSTGYPREAAELLRRAVALQPDIGEWHAQLAQAYRRDERSEAAIAEFEQALRMPPVNPYHLYLYGELLIDLQRLDEAIARLRQALELDPELTEVYSTLAFLAGTGDYEFTDDERGRLHRLLQRDDLPDSRRYHLHFAEANLLHREQRYAEAYQAYVAANRAKRGTHQSWEQFDPQAEQTLFEQHRDLFQDEFIHARGSWGSASEKPVFIIGMLRTGTTLLEKILASHPRVTGRGELTDIRIIAHNRLRQLTGRRYPQSLRYVKQPQILQQANWYLERLTRSDQQAARFINKMPTDFQMLGLIHLLFPDAFIIHTVRDPMDTLWSCFARDVHARFSNDFDDLVAMYRLYRQYMRFWISRLDLRLHEVRYENLVNDFETEVRKAVDFLQLDWDERCLRYFEHRGKVDTPSRMQVRKPIYRGAAGAWKKYAEQLQPLQQRLSELERELRQAAT